ncbi:tetratricopeptide repeat protein [Candidatus Poribacteria bacterium]|nr:tetratricopeptide repeat protein [Candidatus Poribacteria bacterium]
MRVEPGSRRALWLGAALLIATLLAYLPALRAGYIWDDDNYLTNRAVLLAPGGVGEIWSNPRATPQYYPMVFTSLWVEIQVWGLEFPTGYHLSNVLLHAANALLFYRVLRRLGLHTAAPLATGLFALHPVMVESVAWIAERKNVLSLFFYLAAALMYLRWANVEGAGQRERVTWWWVAFGLFVLALLSKTVTCSLPAALLLVLCWKRGRCTRDEFLPLLPFFAAGLALAMLTVWLETHVVGSKFVDFGLSRADRLVLAGRAAWFYAGKLAWPHPLIFFYPRWEIDAGALWQWLFPVASVAVVAGLWAARRRIGVGPLVGVLIYVGTLVPALGFINVYPFRFSWVADHFQYHASLAFFALAAGGLCRVADRLALAVRVRLGMAAVLLAVLGTLTFQHAQAFQDSRRLYEETLARNPTAWIAHYNLANILQVDGRFTDAIAHYEEAARHGGEPRKFLINWGVALLRLGKPHEAVRRLEEALALEPRHPTVRLNLALALQAAGRFDDALDMYREAGAGNPEVQARSAAGMAVILAAHPDPARRRPVEALRLAEFSVQPPNEARPQHLQALAIALAANAQFEAALRNSSNARDSAKSAGLTELERELGEQATLFAEGKPFVLSEPVSAQGHP